MTKILMFSCLEGKKRYSFYYIGARSLQIPVWIVWSELPVGSFGVKLSKVKCSGNTNTGQICAKSVNGSNPLLFS
jgi:hypothetical protein